MDEVPRFAVTSMTYVWCGCLCRLQGYLLDGLSGDDISKLIGALTQAAERVKLCVQLRKLQTAKPPGSGGATDKQSADEVM